MRISDWSSDVCSSDLAFWEYYMWNWRRVRGLREVRAALAAPRFNTPRQRRFEGAVERGRRRIMRRFAAFDIVGSQMVSAMFNANDIAYRMKSAGEDPFERSHTGGHATLRTDIWQRAMPSARRIIRNNLPGWSESFDLKESVVPADPIQKERDLVARGFVQSRPVIHMVHGINQILEDHEKDLRSEEHTSELQSLMRISYAVFCLKQKRKKQ